MTPAIATGCPAGDILATFASGKLDESSADLVVAHLEGCPACQKSVDKMAPRPDSLVKALRQVHTDSASGGQQLEKLIQAAAIRETLPPTGSSTKQINTASDSVDLPTFVDGVRRSGLVEPEEVDQLHGSLKPKDARAFARALVKNGKLTKFQAQAIIQGRHQHLVLGNYVVLEPLGEGGMGRVFKAQHRQLGRIVCLKVLHAAGRKSPQLVERFRREAKMVAALSHPNIVVAHDADEADGVPYIAMEFIRGQDLAKHVEEQGPFQPVDAVHVILQAARALEYSHSQGVVHRDIKPSNILLASEAKDSSGDTPLAKVLDLGLARFDSFLGDSPDALTHTSMTSTGVVMGTVDYMSPEQALNSRKADNRADIYSLGCTLYFLLTGEVMFQGETVMEKLIAHRERAVPSLIDSGAEVPASLDAIFQRMVAKDVDDRYPNMTAIIEDLQLFLDGGMPQAMQLAASPLLVESPALPDSRKARQRQTLAMGIGVAAMLLVMVLGGVIVASVDWGETLGPLMGLDPVAEPETTRPAIERPAPEPLIGHADTLANGGQGRALMVVPHHWFYEDHYEKVHQALTDRGMTVQVASSTTDPAKPKHDKIPPVDVDLTLDEYDVDDFDAVVFVGGNVHEFTHKNPEVGDKAKAVIAASLEKRRAVIGVGNGWDAVKDTGLCQQCKFENDGQLQKGQAEDGKPGIFLVSKGCDTADHLVDVMLTELAATAE